MNLLDPKNVLLHIIYSVKSQLDNLKCKKFTNIIFEKQCASSHVVLLALYEKDTLRDDVKLLLNVCKKLGVYIVAVNTLKLAHPEKYNELIDVYLERDNFGRDFGSYQEGFKYIFNKGIESNCSRILMLNDSVFYSSVGLEEFIIKMLNTKKDASGATENFEISRHIGSFCVSISGEVSRSERFKSFWLKYKKNNVRPRIIKDGEMALTKTLEACSKGPAYFGVEYGVTQVEFKMREKDFMIDYIKEMRWGTLQGYGKEVYNICYIVRNDEMLMSFVKNNIYDVLGIKISKNKILTENNEKEFNDILSDELLLISFFENCDYIKIPFGESVLKRLAGRCVDLFTFSSQIHTNCVNLLLIGLPIIKLDLVYREMAGKGDILRIRDHLAEEEKQSFTDLLLSRDYGRRNMFGFERLSFLYGYI